MKKLLLTIVAWATGVSFAKSRGRMITADAAFQFRMGAGFPGDVNRTHPASIEPVLIDAAAPPTAYGQAVLAAAANAGVRPYTAGDETLDTPWGVTVRPFPAQQDSASNFGSASFGSATPPTTGAMDVLRSGYVMVKVPAGTSPNKGGAVFVRTQNAGAGQVNGGFEIAADAGNTSALDPKKYFFNGPADADGNCEISFNV